jgi:hypothetical protein
VAITAVKAREITFNVILCNRSRVMPAFSIPVGIEEFFKAGKTIFNPE